MKNLQLENPIDEHLKPIKDSDGVLTSVEISTDKVRIINLDSRKLSIAGGAEITSINDTDSFSEDSATALATQQSIKAYVDAEVAPALKIRIHPTDFMVNDDFASGRLGNIIEDDTSNTLGYRMGNTSTECYAFVKIPDGYTAIDAIVYASASTSSAVEVYQYTYNTGATASKGTGDFNSSVDITDVGSGTFVDLVIKILPASTSTLIYGSSVTIQAT